MVSSSSLSKYNAIIVDPESASRLRLRQATSAVSEFGKIAQCQELSEAQKVVETQKDIDIVFLSRRIQSDQVAPFIDRIKNSKHGGNIAFIMALESQEGSNPSIALNLLGGADGFLVEPYSVNSLRDTTVLAARIKKERSRERERAAVRLLIKEIISQVDVVAQLRANGHEAKISMTNLKDMCSVIHTFPAELQQYYFEAAADMFAAAPVAAAPQHTKIYTGASKRLKQRTEQKLNKAVAMDNALNQMGQLKKSSGA